MFSFGFLLLIAHLYMNVIVQKRNFIFACPFHSENHKIEQRDVWNYLKKKTQSWKAELNDWVGEFENLVGPPDPIMFEDPNVGRWVDPLASWEVMDYKESETTTEKENFSIIYSDNATIESIKTETNGTTGKLFALKTVVTEQTATTLKSISPTPTQNKGGTKTLTTIVSKSTGDGESEKPQTTSTTTVTTLVSEIAGSGESESTSATV